MLRRLIVLAAFNMAGTSVAAEPWLIKSRHETVAAWLARALGPSSFKDGDRIFVRWAKLRAALGELAIAYL